MIAVLCSVAILGLTVAGILAVRTLSARVRIGFDVVCLTVAVVVLYQNGVTPLMLPPLGAENSPSIWLRTVAVAWWILSARLLVVVLYYALGHDRKSREAKLFIDLTAAAVYVGAGLIVLKSVLALSVGGLVATSGVVAIVLGLALQNTLSDVFSGIAVDIEAPFQVGDRISLGNNIEGQVVEMNWRSIRVQTDGADIATIPNSVVAKLTILNRSVPTRVRTVSVQLWCPDSSDPERVLEVLREATLLCPDILATPAPNTSLGRMGPHWNNYSISFSVADTQLVGATKSLLLRHARKQLHHARLLEKRRRSREDTPCNLLPVRESLRELAVFECLSPAQLDELAGHVTTQRLAPGELLFGQGSTDATMYIVASGVVEISQLNDGLAVTLGNLGAGEYVGEIGLLTGTPHAATARAGTHCYIHQLSRAALEPLLTANPALAAALDQSARAGLDLLKRAVAARATEPVDESGQLLQKIRAFFRFNGGV